MRALALSLSGLALLAGGCGGEPRAAGPAAGSTLDGTLLDRDGDGFLERGPAEPLRERRELGGGRGRPVRTLASFAQITDLHVRDEESPARVPFLDRLGTPFTSTFRPHEALSAHVVDATVRALNRRRPQAVVVTGDIIDSAQSNELEQALATLRGGRVDPDSGVAGYAGVQAAGNPDPYYYRPDHDAPRHPGLNAAAALPFHAEGLRAPWYPAAGNHDLLVQGEVPATPRIEEVATGGEMVTGLDPSLRPPSGSVDVPAAVDALLSSASSFGRTERVPADAGRRHPAPAQMVARLRRAAGLPDPTGSSGSRLDYVFDVGRHLRGIVLDTVRRSGGSRGVVTPAQVAWLRDRLARAGRRRVVVFSHNPLAASDGGDAALAALAASPRVAAAVAGHRHGNRIEPHPGGFWLVETSSLADHPQQARMFRLVETAGGAALETWMVDHDGRGLAGTARELAYLDAQGGRPQGFAGARSDRNARLRLP